MSNIRKKPVFSVLFAVLYVVLYFALATGINALIGQPLVATVIADVIVVVGYFVCKKYDVDNDLSFGRDVNRESLSFKSVCLTLLVLLIGFFIVFLSVQIFSLSFPELVTKNLLKRHDAMTSLGEDSFIVILLSSVLAPVCEECIFRGIVLPVFSRKFGYVFSVFISSFVFGLFHGTLLHIIVAPLLGLFCAYAYYLTGNIVSSILVHSGYNTLLMVLASMNATLPVMSRYTSAFVLILGYLSVIVMFVVTVTLSDRRMKPKRL